MHEGNMKQFLSLPYCVIVTDSAARSFSGPTYRGKPHPRGMIKRGAYADIVIFDHEKVIDRATFKNPFLKPEGIRYVFINGVPALWEGHLTGSKSGRILRHGR